MSNFDDIFAGQNGSSQWKNQSFDKEAWAAKKQEERKEMKCYYKEMIYSSMNTIRLQDLSNCYE